MNLSISRSATFCKLSDIIKGSIECNQDAHCFAVDYLDEEHRRATLSACTDILSENISDNLQNQAIYI